MSSTPIHTVSQSFFFDAAHTLRRQVEAEGSARIHGHTYEAEVSFSGPVQADTGMVVDLGWVRQRIASIREQLDHRLLDEVPELGIPTLENLCSFIAQQLGSFQAPNSQAQLVAVKVWRAGIRDACEWRLAPNLGK